MHCDFLGSDGLQETHMDALKLFNFKYVILKIRGGFFTKFAALAYGVAPPYQLGRGLGTEVVFGAGAWSVF